MAEKPETRLKNRLRPQLARLPFSWWVKVQQVAIVGTPDFLGCIRGTFVALELKSTKRDKLRPMQEYNLAQIKNAGGIGLVVHGDNWQTVLQFLQKLAKGEIRNVEGDL